MCEYFLEKEFFDRTTWVATCRTSKVHRIAALNSSHANLKFCRLLPFPPFSSMFIHFREAIIVPGVFSAGLQLQPFGNEKTSGGLDLMTSPKKNMKMPRAMDPSRPWSQMTTPFRNWEASLQQFRTHWMPFWKMQRKVTRSDWLEWL